MVKYKYLIVNLVFSHFGFWSGNSFLIAPSPDHCLLVPFLKLLGASNIYMYMYINSQLSVSEYTSACLATPKVLSTSSQMSS